MKIVFFFILIVLLSSCVNRQSERSDLKGRLMPSFELMLVDSTTYLETGKISVGEPVVLYYFSPRCPFCKAQTNEIIKNISKLGNIRFYILTSWPFNEMRDFYNEYQLYRFPNIAMGMDYKNFFEGYFQIPGVPYMAIYGKDKRFRSAFAGIVYSDQIRRIAND